MTSEGIKIHLLYGRENKTYTSTYRIHFLNLFFRVLNFKTKRSSIRRQSLSRQHHDEASCFVRYPFFSIFKHPGRHANHPTEE